MTDRSPAAAPLAAALALAPAIRARRAEIEAGRKLPADLVEPMTRANLFQLGLPRSMGGPQAAPRETFEAIEALARADGSVGWCASIATSISIFVGGWIPAATGRELFGTPPDARLAGSVRAEGQAQPVPGGYRIRGRWDFASGIQHANWLFCTCAVPPPGGEDVPGAKTVVQALVPAAEAEIVDTWTVVGMKGTGSHDFVVDDVFVPAERIFSLGDRPRASGSLYHPRLGMVCAWTGSAAVALGIARGALDGFVALAADTASSGSTVALADRPLVQTRTAEAEAIVGGARAYLLETVQAAWDAVESGASDPGLAIARARLAITRAMHEAVRAVDLLFHAAGTNAVYAKHPLERCFRDVHVAVQHAAAQPGHVETAGRVLLGRPVREPGW